MADHKAKIIEELEVMMRHAQKEKGIFQVRAYAKVIGQVKAISGAVRTMDDLVGVDGIGSGIRKKIVEILSTGTLAAAEEIKDNSEENFIDSLMNIYGVGPAKAKSIVAAYPNLRTIAELRVVSVTDKKLLNEKQKIGLKHYEDLLLRIPRDEMHEHELAVIDSFHKVSSKFTVSIVGSFRRGAATSGDIDVLVTLPKTLETKGESLFHDAVTAMTTSGYITNTLALGAKKFMGISHINQAGIARRLDILLTTKAEYPYALLYFTGSDKFNINFRREVVKQGYSLSEHGVKIMKEDAANVPAMKTERDIFDFFKILYTPPSQR